MGSYAYPEEDLTFSNGLLKYNNSSFQQATELDYSIEEPIPLRDTRYVWHNHVNLSLTGTYKIEIVGVNLLVKNGDQTICCRYFKFRTFNGNLNMAFQVRHSIRSPSAEFRLCVQATTAIVDTVIVESTAIVE